MGEAGRRVVRRATWVVLAVMIAALAISALKSDKTGPADPRARVDGYPQRIGFERPSDTLPSRPGALAGTMYDNDFGDGRQLGISPRGRLWELPRETDLLSPDGRELLTSIGEDSGGHGENRLAVRDLARGTSHTLDEITDSLDVRDRAVRYHLDSYGQAFWSPDQATMLAGIAERPHPSRFTPRLLDLVSGAVVALGHGQPAGFRTASEAVTVDKVGGARARGGIVMETWTASGHRVARRPLQLAGPWRGDPDADLTASVSPDGQSLLLVEIPHGAGRTGRLRLFSTSDGDELPSREVRHWDGGHNCPVEWLSREPVIPTKRQAAGVEVITRTSTKRLVAVHHRLQSSCLHITIDALEAGPHRALFGASTQLWTWYWKPLAICLLLIAALASWNWRGSGRKAV